MSRIIQPVVSPRGRVIVLTGATLWLIATMVLSATPEGAAAEPGRALGGNLVALSFESVAGAPGMLAFPRLHTDADGRVYIADRAGHRVIRMAPDRIEGEVIFGREGAGPGELMYPRSVATDSAGNVFVTDVQLQRLLKYAPNGTFIKSITAPRVVAVLVDSQDRVIVRPGRDNAQLERYTNDLAPDAALLERTPSQHDSPLGVLLAIGADDRLFVLDQSALEVSVYDAGMELLDRWPVDPPGLQQTVAMRLAAARARSPEGGATVDGILSMALHPDGEHLVFAYKLTPSSDVTEAKVAWFHVDGRLELVEDRGDETVYANAFLPDGAILEGTAERVHIRVQGTATNAELENE